MSAMTGGPNFFKPRPKRGQALLFLMIVAATSLLLQQMRCRAPLGAGQPAQHPGQAAAVASEVVQAGFGGVHRYSIPGQFEKSPPATDSGPRAGTLHIYLKALRWPVRRLAAGSACTQAEP
jgi:hypothetical protein